MFLEIITPERCVFSGDVQLVQLPGSSGSFELLNKHAPIISTLEDGVIKTINLEGSVTRYTVIGGGVVEMNENKIIVLAEGIQ